MATSWRRRLGLGVLAVSLLVTLGTANLVVGVDRTVLNAEFVTEGLAEEAVYEVAADEMQTQLAATATGDAAPGGGDGTQEALQDDDGDIAPDGDPMSGMGAVLEGVVTPTYLQGQLEANIVNLYDYLHGRDDDLVLEVDLVPVKERLAPEMAAAFAADLTTIDPTLAAMAESEASFHAEREAFAARQMDRIQAETDEELSEAELRARYDERRPEIREELLEVAAAGGGEDEAVSPELESALYALAVVRVDGLVSADVTYESFTSDLESATDAFADAAEPAIARQVDDELPDTMDLTAEMEPETTNTLETVRTGVSVLGTLTYVLPLLALGLAGLIGWMTRTRSGGLFIVGSVTAVAGLGWVAVLTMAQPTIAREFDAAVAAGSMNAEVANAILGLFGRTLDVFSTQSWVLLGVGTTLLLAGIGIRRGRIPVEDVPDGETQAAGAPDSTSTPVEIEHAAADPGAARDAADEADIQADEDDADDTDHTDETDGSDRS